MPETQSQELKNMPADDKASALETIKEEHRSIAGVLKLLQRLLEDIAVEHTEVDFGLLAAALYYLDDFASRCHHPKEDNYLFVAIRQHLPNALTTLNGLQAEHQRDDHYIRELHRLLVLYQAGAPEALKRLIGSLDIYAAMLYDHMRKEEMLFDTIGDSIPQTQWRDIAERFAADDDPLFGKSPKEEFAKLRHRIVNLLPRKMRPQP
jgi:hemerythrin-like domain-containing protein